MLCVSEFFISYSRSSVSRLASPDSLIPRLSFCLALSVMPSKYSSIASTCSRVSLLSLFIIPNTIRVFSPLNSKL